MFTSFKEAEDFVLSNNVKKRLVLCGSHDDAALEAVIAAHNKGIIEGILIGDEKKTRELVSKLGANQDDFRYINEPDEVLSANVGIKMVRDGEADIPMKGLMQTSTYIRAVLNKETGILKKGNLLSCYNVIEYARQNRLLFIADPAISVNPRVEDKVKIIHNTVEGAKCFGFEKPKVAVLSAVEKVNPKLQSSVDAEALNNMEWNDCVVQGPLALDNALDSQAAKHKGITGPVAGRADILIASDLNMGNVLAKASHYFGGFVMAGVMCGADYPIVATSRTESPEGKYYSILFAILESLTKNSK